MKTVLIKKHIFLAIILVIMVLLSSLANFLLPPGNTHSQKDFHILLTQRINDAIDAAIEGPIVVAKTMANDNLINNYLINEDNYDEEEIINIMAGWLKDIKESGEFTSAFLVSEKSHRYYTPEGLNKIVNPQTDSHDIWYTNFIKSNLPISLDVDIDQMNHNSWTVFLNARITDDKGNLLGVCGIGIIMSKLQKLFEQYEELYSVKINLVDYDGLVQVDTSNVNIENSYRSTELTSKEEKVVYTELKNGFVTCCYISEMDWYLVIRNTDKNHSKVHFNYKFIQVELLIIFFGFLAVLYLFKNEIKLSKNNTNKNTVDLLTGVYNRNYFKEVYGEHGIFNTTRYKSLAVIDIDFFKEQNDHINGDKILVSLVEIIKKTFGNECEIFRWGGDAFTILLTESLNDSYDLCRKLCKEVESSLNITVSVGITEVQLADSIKKNYYRAAQGCFFVKELGGNGVKRS